MLHEVDCIIRRSGDGISMGLQHWDQYQALFGEEEVQLTFCIRGGIRLPFTADVFTPLGFFRLLYMIRVRGEVAATVAIQVYVFVQFHVQYQHRWQYASGLTWSNVVWHASRARMTLALVPLCTCASPTGGQQHHSIACAGIRARERGVVGRVRAHGRSSAHSWSSAVAPWKRGPCLRGWS